MGSTSDFRNGLVIRFKSELYSIVEFQHVKPGKGGAFVRTRLKNVKTGRVIENTFRSGESVDVVRLEEKKMQYLYQDGSHYVFMDQNTYDQVHIGEDIVGDDSKYLKEGEICTISFQEEQPITLELPNFITFRVEQTDPGHKGDTVTGGNKPARLETGAVVNVPLFIDVGDLVRIDTRSNTYIERVKE